MRFFLAAFSFVLGAGLAFQAGADPILPFQQPIAAQLNADISGSVGDVRNLNRALDDFHRRSQSLRGDMNILRNLDRRLSETAAYVTLLSNAAISYQTNFQSHRDELYAQLIPAPISGNKTVARSRLRRADASISNAVHAASTTTRIVQLRNAAQRLGLATNAVQRALHTRSGFSSMVARIGVLSFRSDRGAITGGAQFRTEAGGQIGQFSPDGVLTVSALDRGSVARGIHLHVEGINSNAPGVYPLGVGANRAFYDAADLRYRREYHFQVDPALTNSVVTNAYLSIDYIGANYLLGRFAFMGTNIAPRTPTDTNTIVTVREGEFQLNFNR